MIAAAPTTHTRRNFRLLWLGGSVADVGIGAFIFTVPLIVLRLTGSAGIAGLVVGIVGAFGIAGLWISGPVTDRFNRRAVMIWSQALQGLIFLAMLLLLILGFLPLPALVCLTSLGALVAPMNDTAESALLPDLVPQEQLSTYHTKFQARSHAANLVAPLIGGVLLGAGPSLVLGLAVVGCFSATICNLFMIVERPSGHASSDGLIHSFSVGFRSIAGQPDLRSIVLTQFFANGGISGGLFLVVVSLGVSGTAPQLIGLATGVVGACGVLGAMLAPLLTSRLSFHRVMVLAVVVAFAMLVAMTLLAGSLWMVLPLSLSILVAPSSGAVAYARIAAVTTDGQLGRVLSSQSLIAIAGGTATKSATGVVFGTFGAYCAGALAAASALASVFVALRFQARDSRS